MKIQKSLILVALLLMLTVSLVACDNNNDKNNTSAEFSGEIFLAGSSTLAPTISQIADSFKNRYGTWDKVDPNLPAKEISISVSTGGSGAGAKAVIDKTASFGMLARELKTEEKEAIEDVQEFKVGIDALLMAVNKENKLGNGRTDLTTEEIKLIFGGEISTWNEFDSTLPGSEIVLMVRDVGGGAHEVFQKAIMGDDDVSNKAIEMPSMAGLVERLAGNASAIGYASYGVAEQHRDDLVVFSVDGIEPSSDNISEGAYPVARPLILVSSGQLSAAEEAFVNYIKSEVGYSIISEMGFLPIQ